MRFCFPLVLLLFLLASSTLAAKEVVWKVETGKKTKLVYEDGVKKFNWSWTRNDGNTISPFSAEEKRWMGAIFPNARFRLLKNGDGGFPDEYLVLPDRRVLAKDDFFPVPAGGDGIQALFFLIRPPDGLVAADGREEINVSLPPSPPPPPPEPPKSELDLDTLLYMDNPPSPAPVNLEAAFEEEPPPLPLPFQQDPGSEVDRSRIAGELHFLVVDTASKGACKVLHRAQPVGPLPAVDVLRIRSFPLGVDQAFGVAFGWSGEVSGTFHQEYRLFSRGNWGVVQAWKTRLVDYLEAPLDRRATRFAFSKSAGGGIPELLVREVNLSSMQERPDPRAFLPRVASQDFPEMGRGVVDIYRLKNGRFKKVGRADQAKGNELVALRKNWPDYMARGSRGPSLLLSFGNPGSPLEAYPCPWPGHPAKKVPWVDGKSLFKGKQFLRGERDLELAVWFLHDPQALYVMTVIRDDALVLPGLNGDPAEGDHLQLWLDPQYGEQSVMLELFPGSPPGAGAFARVRSPSSRVGPATRVRVAARAFEGGYWLEAAIPFRYLEELGIRPSGSLWGVVVNAVDVDDPKDLEAKTVLSTSKNFAWAKTGTFNNLILE